MDKLYKPLFHLLAYGIFAFLKDFLFQIEKIWSFTKNWFDFRGFFEFNRSEQPKSRLDFHDIWNSKNICNVALAPFPEEIEYANPKMNKAEDLFIYGTNTGDQTALEIYFKRRPCGSESPKDHISVQFKLYDSLGCTYFMDEQEVVQFNPNEYRGAGFAFESLQANKTERIKFRGYLRKVGDADPNRLYYVQIRFLCLFFTKTFDHLNQFDPNFLSSDLLIQRSDSVEELLEDKIEQFCQIKGTFKIEDQEESELFFLGSIGRRFLPKSTESNRQILKIQGFCKDGFGFQLGLVKSDKQTYRYGFASQNGHNFKLLTELSLSKEDLEKFLKNSEQIFVFNAKFGDNPESYQFEVTGFRDNQRLIKINGIQGMAFVIEQEFNETQKIFAKFENLKNSLQSMNLVVNLDQDCARFVELTGGKGSSLAQLEKLSKESTDSGWSVPNALIVTTAAYRIQTESIHSFKERIQELELKVRTNSDSKKVCEDMVKWFSGQILHESIKIEIQKQMNQEFGEFWSEKSFAVRSSAAMEDSQEMSAAGQMTTFLGVKGLENLGCAVVKCWASQFGFVPIEYKRGYGQSLNSPMAVVIQQMVDCDAAGVIFTVNPLDGDERVMTVTSNFGLGESVVSAAADPDTFQLEVGIRANSYSVPRKVVKILCKNLGKKSLVTRMFENGVHNQIQIEDASQRQSLVDTDLIRLGNIALEIQAHYGNARDLEWGLKSGCIHIFQSRPVTNLDSGFTQYELMHESDSAHMSEQELYSRSHWGENFPGASSWLGGYFFLNGAQFLKSQILLGTFKEDDYNPFRSTWGYVCNQLMFDLKNGPFQAIFKGYPSNEVAVASVFAFFGDHIKDPDVLAAFQNAPNSTKRSWKSKLALPRMLLAIFFTLPKKIHSLKQQMFEHDCDDLINLMKSLPLKDKVNHTFRYVSTGYQILGLHRLASFGSTIKSMFLIKMLKSFANHEMMENDRNLLMSHCNDVVSAEVPSMLRDIARAIQNRQIFAELEDEKALEVLKSKDSYEKNASNLFEAFIARHGHRGYREMDPLHVPWRESPIPCIQVIKSLLKGDPSCLEPKPERSISQVLSSIQTPLPWFKRFLLQHFLIPWCRDAVGFRENTKSLMVKFADNIRKALNQIAKDLVQEGILSEMDLLFYLRIDEIMRLTNGERNPLLVMKAKQRKRLYPLMDRMKFDKFIKGFRMEPRNQESTAIYNSSVACALKGTPVTIGSVCARVCVAESIHDASNLQPGDILLTYSTDIGWSPYFPLLSGIVTEIGGTISHGAVIAREYGIPCLIAVENACAHFKTGDMARLDTRRGEILKLDSQN